MYGSRDLDFLSVVQAKANWTIRPNPETWGFGMENWLVGKHCTSGVYFRRSCNSSNSGKAFTISTG